MVCLLFIIKGFVLSLTRFLMLKKIYAIALQRKSLLAEKYPRIIMDGDHINEIANRSKKTSFEVPASVSKAAAKGLKLREEFGRGGLSIQEASKQGILNRYGYHCIHLTANGRNHHVTVHCLVAIAFVDGYFEGAQINHIDGVKTNNSPVNLEFCTSAHNVNHSIVTGLRDNFGVKHWACKLTEDQVLEIRKLHSEGMTQTALSKIYGLTIAAIGKVVNRKRWKDIA